MRSLPAGPGGVDPITMMKRLLKALLPKSVLAFLIRQKQNYDVIRQKEKRELDRVSQISPDISNLSQEISKDSLREIFRITKTEGEWCEDSPELSSFSIAQTAGGVNPGDRRAIYYLLRHFQPRSVLEIGTHVGASTIYAIAALKRSLGVQAGTVKLVTVDISDVNDPATRPWIQWGSKHSPREMVQSLGASNWVTFITRSSIEFFSNGTEHYDFIFLDGDHSAKTVYREIPAALKQLNPNGVILLHDYFPSGQLLWKGKPPILGPWLAVQRCQSEGVPLKILFSLSHTANMRPMDKSVPDTKLR